jgi:pSer/pThr/pTyr-binding forkhead associated (FHA) protein
VVCGGGQVVGGRRGDGVDVVLPLDGVSGKHCKFEVVRGGVKVTDLGSTNGTQINGRNVSNPPQPLPQCP